ncbi:MAG: PQQ-like beta-propeller repeat protein [Kiritimatiellales bacterium]|nr:PQQ-like beta-propeller repeat protein [Kiritimatiellales bacterium]
MTKLVLSTVLLVAMIPSFLMADNWAHWRGPTGNGMAANAHPPVEWSSIKNVKWKVAVPGRGTGSPVIWEQRVFVVTAVPTGNKAVGNDTAQQKPPVESSKRPQSQGDRKGRGRPGGRSSGGGATEMAFKILCFDRSSGKLLWEQTATIATPHQRTHTTNGFASASPCTDGQHVYVHFGSRGLYCYTMDGKLVWNRKFGEMDTRSSFGEGSSPTLAGGKILVPWDHEGASFLYALDKLNGETLWKTERDEPTCWATPLVVDHNGAKQVVMNGQTCARAYDLETGKERWRCGGQTERPVASAVAADGLVIIGSGYKGCFMGAFRLDGQGDIENTKHVVWTLDKDTPDIGSPLLSDGRVYFYKGKSGDLSCVDAATGKPHYMTADIPGLKSTYASPMAAGGHVYLTGRSGTTVVIKDSDKLTIVASNSVGETVDATPAPVDNELFIRGENHLFCISE